MAYSSWPDGPLRIHGNRATSVGGGAFVSALEDPWPARGSKVLLSLWGVRIDANRARNGAAIYARNLDRTGLAISARVEINLPGSRPDAMFCARPEDCGSIDGNLAVDQTDTPTDGAVLAADEGLVLLDKSRIRHNRAGSIVHATAGGGMPMSPTA